MKAGLLPAYYFRHYKKAPCDELGSLAWSFFMLEFIANEKRPWQESLVGHKKSRPYRLFTFLARRDF